MNSLFRLVFGFGIAVALLALTFNLSSAQFPDPKDEAKLYELAKKEGTVFYYGSAPLESMQATNKDFEAKYPGIKVEVLRYTAVRGYQRFLMETNAKQYIADLVHISDIPSMEALVKENLIAEWKVPTSDRIPASFRIGNYSYGPYSVTIAIIYNVNKMTPEEVKILDSSWKGVLDPRFKGRFTVMTHKCSTCYMGVHMFLDPKYTKVFGPEFIKAVAVQKPALYSDSMVAMDRVIAGEHDFTYWTWESIAYLKWLQGVPIRWIHSDPTPEYVSSMYGVSKYAPHPNAARLFLNWLMSEDGALSFQKAGFKTVIQGIKDTRKMVGEPWYRPIKTRYDIDFERWARDYNKDMDFWAKTMEEGR